MTCDYHNIAILYESIAKAFSERILIKEVVTDEISSEVTEPEIRKISIHIKSGKDNPRLAYQGNVTSYEKRGPITVIDAIDGDKKILIKIDKNDATDVTIIDDNDNIEDEFVVHGMQLRDPFRPEELSIIKVEEVV